MSESQERTEEATPRRVDAARKKGKVAVSADLTAALSLAALGLALFPLGSAFAKWLLAWSSFVFESAPSNGRMVHKEQGLVRTVEGTTDCIFALIKQALMGSAGFVLLFVLLAAVIATASTLLQTKVIFAPTVIAPDFQRLNPIEGAKRLVSLSRLMVIPRAVLAFLVVGCTLVCLTRDRVRDILLMSHGGVDVLSTLIFEHASILIAVAGALLLLPGALDLAVSRRHMARQLRMTKKELRDEIKQDEGDPRHKGHRRETHRQIMQSPPLKEATVLIVNPTHLAIALHHGSSFPVPIVGNRGTGDQAITLRLRARREGIPIMRDIALARALLTLPPGSEVPESLFKAVATVLAAVYRAELRRENEIAASSSSGRS